MIYFDASYVARLYVEDTGWEKVRELATRHPVASCIHGRAEVIAAFHRKLREGVFTSVQYRQVLAQFELDCDEDAYRWLSLSHAVAARLTKAFESLPSTTFLRASDAIHFALLRRDFSNNAVEEIALNSPQSS